LIILTIVIYEVLTHLYKFGYTKSVVLKVVDIDPQGSIGPPKGTINSQRVEWGSLNGQGVKGLLEQ